MLNKQLLGIKNLCISLKVENNFVKIVDDVSFNLNYGEVIAVVGESGCGKTVTSQAIPRLLPKELIIQSGRILFHTGENNGILDLSKLNPKDKNIRKIRGKYIGMIFQEPMSSFSPVYTIGNQIREVIQLHRGLSKKEARKVVVDLLDKVGIPNPSVAASQYPHEFSGGMRQRAMIARALSCNPALLIADEPTSSLDVTIQAQILVLMKQLQEEFEMSVIFITHELGVVAQIADRVYVMYLGKIVEEGKVRDVFGNPKHPYTKDLINAIPIIGNLGERRKLMPIKGNVPSIYERSKGCNFYPRCDSFIPERCNVNFPPCIQVNSNHCVWCYLYV
jgi:peptide/nickel transport system ATP-binding protein